MRSAKALGLAAGLVVMLAQVQPASAATWAKDVSLPVSASVTVDSLGCTNHQGPFVTLNGSFTIGGATIQLKLDNNRNKPGIHELETDPVHAELVVSSLTKTKFAKQPPLGGVTGNPAIWVQLMSNGSPVGDPVYVGRCVQGAKKSFNRTFFSPAIFELFANALDCENGGGNQIRFGGTLSGTSGLQAVIILKGGNGKFTDSTVGSVSVELLGSIGPFAKQGSDPNGVTGNPWVSLREVIAGVPGNYTDPVKCNKL